MPQRQRHSNDDLDDLYASLLSQDGSRGSMSPTPRIRKWLAEKKAQERTRQTEEARRLARAKEHQRARFSLGGEPAVRLPKQPVLGDSSHRNKLDGMQQYKNSANRIAISGLESSLDWLGDNNKKIAKLIAIITLVILMAVVPYAIINLRAKQPTSSSGPTSLAPSKVLVPQSLPEGFSVGSATKTLSNGATIYTIYSDKGQEITVTQQVQDASFTQPTVKGALPFKTKSGDAFVQESTDRVTGYLFMDSSWILFNSTSDLASDDLRKLIEVF